MDKIFENAKYGDKFKTKNEKTFIFSHLEGEKVFGYLEGHKDGVYYNLEGISLGFDGLSYTIIKKEDPDYENLFKSSDYYNLLCANYYLTAEIRNRIAKYVEDAGGTYELRKPVDVNGVDAAKSIYLLNEVLVACNKEEGSKNIIFRSDDLVSVLSQIEEENGNNKSLKMKTYKKLKFDNKDIIITDPCYVINNEIDYFSERELFAEGIKNCLIEDTIYGDWSCTVFNTDTEEKIGTFCADAGLVGVFDLQELRLNNKEIDEWIEKHPWCVTKISGFTGEVTFRIDEVDSNSESVYEELHVIGRGNINFESVQTGL